MSRDVDGGGEGDEGSDTAVTDLDEHHGGLGQEQSGIRRQRNFLGAWVRNGIAPAPLQALTVGSTLFISMYFRVEKECFGVVDLMEPAAYLHSRPPSPPSIHEQHRAMRVEQAPDLQRRSRLHDQPMSRPHDHEAPSLFPEYCGLFSFPENSVPNDDFEIDISGATPNCNLDPHNPDPAYLCLSEYYIDTTGTQLESNSIRSADTCKLVTRGPLRFRYGQVVFHKGFMVRLALPGLLQAYRVQDIHDHGMNDAHSVWEQAIPLQNPMGNHCSTLFVSDNQFGDCIVGHIMDDSQREHIFLFELSTGALLAHIPKSSWQTNCNPTQSPIEFRLSPDSAPPSYFHRKTKVFQITPFHLLLIDEVHCFRPSIQRVIYAQGGMCAAPMDQERRTPRTPRLSGFGVSV
ncbi:hypothetical protein HK102_014075 [Quaeritorhiza haematococci]|nr:hypothetical protein HK102_014075 [Quaeritorhiza haematococci]